jgi:hypothetical protein
MSKMRKTLQISRPFGKVGILALLWLLFFIGAAEAAVHLKPVQSQLLAPGVGNPNRTFEIQLDRLNTRVDHGEHIDCVFIGSSRVLVGLDPEAVEKAYANITGNDFKCQNFGVLGMGIQGSAGTATMLANLYHPRLIVIGTNFIDFGVGLPDKAIVDSPFVREHSGHINFDGWVTTWSLAFRDYLAEVSYLAIDNAQDEYNYLGYNITKPNGFLPLIGHKTDNMQNWNNLNVHYKITVESTRPVKSILAIKKGNTQILFLEIPLRTSTFKAVPHAAEYRHEFEDGINFVLQGSGSQIWLTQDLNLIPESGWIESNHLNVDGAEIFSKWVGEQLGKSVKDGSLILPEWSQPNP